MTNSILELLTKDITQKIGNNHFYTPRDLLKLGLFGSIYSVQNAIKSGKIAHVKVSQRRTLIPRIALLEFLRKNLSEKGEKGL